MTQLDEYRAEIDAINRQLIELLGKRFEVTRKVGEYKRDNNLPPADRSREAAILEELGDIALEHELDPELVKELMKIIMARVVSEHAQA